MNNREAFELVVLDLDGTLYDINDVIENVYQCQVNYLAVKLNKSAADVKMFLAENNVFPYVCKESRSATELFLELGISKAEWTDYRNQHFDVNSIQITNSVEKNTLMQLADFATLVLLSSNTSVTIRNILSHLGLTQGMFDSIVCSDCYPIAGSFNKYAAMRFLSERYSVKPQAMLSIGDRFSTDVKPMLRLGGTGILLHSPKSLKTVLTDMKEGNLHNCREYDFYDKLDD